MKTTNFILVMLFCALFFAPSCKNNKKTTQDTAKQITAASDNSMNSLDWNGVYSGVVPCADCDGIQTTVVLKSDNTYEVRTKYLGKDSQEYISTGTFTWNNEGNKITLSNITEAPNQYQVGENRLIQLDMNGNIINSDNNYNLPKVSDLVEKYWKLKEIESTEITKKGDSAREAHMILRVENSRVNGSGGCNSFNGTYTIESENQISFSRVASTMMACPDMDTESKFFRTLENVKSYSVDNDKLELKDANNKVLARFEAVYM